MQNKKKVVKNLTKDLEKAFDPDFVKVKKGIAASRLDWQAKNKQVKEEHNIKETATPQINDAWFKQGAFQTYKKAAPVKYEVPRQPGTVQTLEGPMKYSAQARIITGPKGEQYPMPPEKFNELKDDNGDGTCSPKKIVKLAKVADHDGVVNTSWGEPLNYTAGNDIIVRHGPNDYGVVKNDIFAKTYVKEDYRDAARYAAQAHAGQTRSGGQPYISHPVRVANLVRKYKDSKKLEKLMAAAFLHDTIEDCFDDAEVGYHVIEEKFGKRVADLVMELTSSKEDMEDYDSKADYLTVKMIHMSDDALIIKLADRLQNISDAFTATERFRNKYFEQTTRIVEDIERHRQFNRIHTLLLNEIKALRQEQARSNSKPTIVENTVNGTRFGTAIAMNTYKTQ